MATSSYPTLSQNMGTSSPANRNDPYVSENVYALDREQTSFIALFNLGKEFVLSKNAPGIWQDYYSSSISTVLTELVAGYSEVNNYHAICSRRESYLYEAQLRDSGVAISSNLGYSVYRGENVKLTLTVTPTMDIHINRFDIIGTAGNYDIISLEDRDFQMGVDTDIQVVLGILKITTMTIADSRTYDFRFNNDLVSEDIRLKLDGLEVPTSKILYDLIDDKFVILANPVGGIDVKYLNRFQPERWISFNKYTFMEYVLPTYDWRPHRPYKKGDIVTKVNPVDAMPMLYEAQMDGTSARTEPVWSEEIDQYTADGVQLRWKCIGRLEKQLYFKCTTPGTNLSGAEEPNWPIITGMTVEDGNLSWICIDSFEHSQFFYNTGSELELTYVELEDLRYTEKSLLLDMAVVTSVSLESSYQSAETLAEMRRNAPLYNETRYVIRGREDYRKIFRMITPNAVDANAFDPIPAVVDLTYVKNHTDRVWIADRMVSIGDEVLSTDGNTLVYRAMTSGYCGLSRKGQSGETQPVWIPDGYIVPERTEDDKKPNIPRVVDNQITWEAQFIPLHGVRPDPWQPNHDYEIGQQVYTNTGYYFEAVEFSTEPKWPTVIGQTVQDNEVTWMCVDTIFFEGYEAEYWHQNKTVEVGDFCQPVSPSGYFYRCVIGGTTAAREPDWPTVICAEVEDGTCVWQCYDRTDAGKYTKNHVLEELARYRQYGVSPAIMDDPTLVMIYIEFNIMTIGYIDSVTINNDIFNILNEYQRILEVTVDTETFENRIEDLDYVKIARAKITGNTKAIPWTPGTLYRLKDVVYPPNENGYLYVANRIQTGGFGYSQWTDRSYSGQQEPNWNAKDAQLYDKYEDGHLVWQLLPISDLGGLLPNFWEPDTVYSINAAVLPTSRPDTQIYAKVVEIKYNEPKWPTEPGKSILDGRVYWTCIDPERTGCIMSWDQYAMFSWKLTTSVYKSSAISLN